MNRTNTEATGRGWKLAMVGCVVLALAALPVGAVVPFAGPYLFAAALIGLLVSAIGAWITSG